MSAALHVDLDVLAANIARVRATVSPAELMLVVKDDAYGHGLAPVVRRAQREGVRWFGAFDVVTGAKVREVGGGGLRIFSWIAASRAEVDSAIAHDLDIGIGDPDLLEEVAEAARAAGERPRVHLKIDTGLHRNGVRPEEWPRFIARAAELSVAGCFEVAGVWSHIAEASDDEDDLARAAFDEAVAQARDAGLRPGVRHLAASAASFARPEFRYDLVRVGAYCYGIRPAGGPSERELGIAQVGRLDATVVAIGPGTAHIDVGALDGIPSTLGGRVSVSTPGGLRRLISVEDRATIDAWPGASIGDLVTLFGGSGGPSATDLAEAIDSIGEEIAVRVSPLVPRTYAGSVGDTR